jgi:hypothetical protein
MPEMLGSCLEKKEKTMGRVGYAHRDTHKLVGYAATRLAVRGDLI